MEEWLVHHPEGVVVSDDASPFVRKTLQRLLSDTSNSQRQARFGSSTRGTCLRHQLFVYLGMPGLRSYDPRLQNLFNDGTWRHIRHQIMGLVAGYFTDVEVPFRSKDWNIGTSADAENSDEDWFFELKGTSLFSRIVHNGPPLAHLLQIHTVMLATGHEVCVYLIEDKWTQNWHEMIIRRDPKIIADVKKEMYELNEALTEKRLPKVLAACKQGKGEIFQSCPFRKDCPRTRNDEWPEQGTWPSQVQVGRRKKTPEQMARRTR